MNFSANRNWRWIRGLVAGRIAAFVVGSFLCAGVLHAQLAITEAMSSASTNRGPASVSQNSDYWELTNFGKTAIDLTGYKFDDGDNNLAAADPTPFDGLAIGSGESIVFVQNNFTTNAAAFREWWGPALPANLKIVFYTGNGLSSTGDGIRLWGPNAKDVNDVVDRVDFAEAVRGQAFTYDPVTGEFPVVSTDGVAGAFKAEATDDIGSPGKTSGPTPLTITQQPLDLLVNPGDTAKLSVGVRGRPRGTYQWYFKSSPVDGATGATLEIPNVQSESTGNYRVEISNGTHSVTSRVAQVVLRTDAAAPKLTAAPTDLWMYVGQGFTFTAAATGLPQPAFRWQHDGQDLPDATGAELALAGVSEVDSGLYSVIASNELGSATNDFRVTVTAKPQLVVTEVMSSGSTNVTGHADWWELTNLGTFPVSLRGFRYDDNSETLKAAFTFTNAVAIAPGEAVVFVEAISADDFRAWWGAENLRPDLQIVTYRGNGLSSLGDAVNLWNAAASEDSDKLASVVFSTATSAVTYGYNSETGQFGDLSVAGQFGAFTAVSGGDVGSPGYIRNSQRVIAPRFTGSKLESGNARLTWSTEAGASYVLQARPEAGAGTWVEVETVVATGTSLTRVVPVDPAAGGRFFRVLRQP